MIGPHQNPFVDNILRLMANQSQVAADNVRQQGDISARMWGGIGSNISNTMGDLLKYKQDETRRKAQAMDLELKGAQLQDVRQEQTDRAQMDDAMKVSGGDPEKALLELRRRGSGAVSALGKLQTQVVQQRRAGEDDMLKKLDIAHKQTTLIAQQVQGIHSLPLEERPAAWTAAYPSITAAIGPDLAKRIPAEYDVKAVDNLLSAGQTLTEHMELRRLALQDARDARDNTKADEDLDERQTKNLGSWLSTVGSEEEWQGVRKHATAPKENGGLGMPAKTVAKFPEHWSPAAVKTAENLSMTVAERNARTVRAGTEEDAVNRYARELKKDPKDLTQKEVNNALARRAYALQNHDATADLTGAERARYVQTVLKNPRAYQGLSTSVKTAIANDLADAGFTEFGVPALSMKVRLDTLQRREIKDIKDEYERSQDPLGGRPKMTEAERDGRIKEIVDHYKELGTDLPGQAPKSPAKVETPSPTPTPTPRPTPTPAAAGSVPPGVVAALKGKPASVYTLKNGTSWLVKPDGSITSVPTPGR